MSALMLDYKPVGDNGTVQLTARLGDDLLAAEKVDLLRPKARDAFAAKLCEHHGSIDRAALDAELLQLAWQLAAKPTPAPSADWPRPTRRKPPAEPPSLGTRRCPPSSWSR